MGNIKKPLISAVSIALIVLLCSYSSGEYMRLGEGGTNDGAQTVFLELTDLPGLSDTSSSSGTTEPAEPPPVTEPPEPDLYFESSFVYGKSGMGRSLTCVSLKSKAAPRDTYKILLVFEIHGFEDAYYRDGQLLVDIANRMLDYYRANIDMLNGCELYVVPSANPDGLLNGYTNNGFGRCQSSGYDINREFDTGLWTPCFSARNKTGDSPLTSPESRALADLVLSLKPDIVIDFHGWLDICIGDRYLYEFFNLYHPMSWHEGNPESGYFTVWAAGVSSRALLYEFPLPTGYNKSYFIGMCSQNAIKGLDRICLNIEDVV